METLTPTETAAIAPRERIIDVREADEVRVIRVPGATVIPMSEIVGRVDELPSDERLYVLCAAGARSAKVTEYLVGSGFDAVNIGGGIAEWASAGLPVERG